MPEADSQTRRESETRRAGKLHLKGVLGQPESIQNSGLMDPDFFLTSSFFIFPYGVWNSPVSVKITRQYEKIIRQPVKVYQSPLQPRR